MLLTLQIPDLSQLYLNNAWIKQGRESVKEREYHKPLPKTKGWKFYGGVILVYCMCGFLAKAGTQ